MDLTIKKLSCKRRKNCQSLDSTQKIKLLHKRKEQQIQKLKEIYLIKEKKELNSKPHRFNHVLNSLRGK